MHLTIFRLPCHPQGEFLTEFPLPLFFTFHPLVTHIYTHGFLGHLG